MKKFLVIQTAFLGDAILATALLEKLHYCFPEARIDILVRKGNEKLFLNHPFLKQVIVRDKKKKLSVLSLLGKIRSEKYDMVINLQRFFTTGLLTAFSGARVKAGFDKNPLSFLFTKVQTHNIGDGRHEVERNIQLLKGICNTDPVNPKLYPGEPDYEKINHYRHRAYVTMAPASVWFTKMLPKNKWLELITTIPNDITIYLIGGPGDNDLCQDIKKDASHPFVENISGKLSFLQTAALMEHARMNYVNDSGPLHIASAMDAPVTAFFCSTIPEFGFGPLSRDAKVIQTVEKLECKPCGLHGRKECPAGHFRCALTIDIPVPVGV